MSLTALIKRIALPIMLALAMVGLGSPVYSQNGTPTPTIEGETYTPLAGHALGPDDAPVTVVMYGDFQCELCARYARDLEILRSRYPGSIRLIWRHLPDTRSHGKAALTLQASEAAAAQGQFWAMHDQLFAHQSEWTGLDQVNFRAVLSEYAATVGLDVTRFNVEVDGGLYTPMVEAALRDAAALEIVGAPQLLFNGTPYSGRDDLFGLNEAVRLALLEQRHFSSPPEMVIDTTKNYRATLVTDKGTIVINLFDDQAPITVNNFVFLAQTGWYDNITFYYVIPDFAAETGDPSDTGRGSPGYTIPYEPGSSTPDRAGLVAMSHPPGLPDNAGSAFFITLAPLQTAETYTIFGEVVEGMDVVRSLTPRNANDPVNFPDPPPGDHVITITIEEY